MVMCSNTTVVMDLRNVGVQKHYEVTSQHDGKSIEPCCYRKIFVTEVMWVDNTLEVRYFPITVLPEVVHSTYSTAVHQALFLFDLFCKL